MMKKIKQRPDVAIIVLTKNAGALWPRWIRCIQKQTVRAGRYLVIDSSSTDNTVDQALAAGLEVYSIAAHQFDHGGTRQLAASLCPDSRYLVYLTQDALLEQSHSLELILRTLDDPTVAMTYGRHQPHADASLLERHARLFTYPEDSAVRTRKDFGRLGYRAAFASDVYAAYRVEALRSIGGFPARMIVSEDSYVAARLLLAGWKTVYCAQSCVLHSHSYSLVQVFRRYFDVGVFHANEKNLLDSVGRPDKEAGAYVSSLIRYLYQHNPWLLPLAAIQTFVKLIGFRLGRRYEKLPAFLCRLISLQKAYWQDKDAVAAERNPQYVQWVCGYKRENLPEIAAFSRKTSKLVKALPGVEVGDTAS